MFCVLVWWESIKARRSHAQGPGYIEPNASMETPLLLEVINKGNLAALLLAENAAL